MVVVLLLPVPWQHVTDDLGIAWRMDDRLVLEGERVDPPGRYSWLSVGRPALVGELAWQRLQARNDAEAKPIARDLRQGDADTRPVHVEPMAAAVGMAVADGKHPHEHTIEPVDAVIGGHGAPYSWIRSLSMGPSHGLMVGLVAYVDTSGDDLADGRHVAGTGTLAADGTVGRIGGLAAKASGALRAGADVLLVPAGQEHELDDVDTGTMLVLAVDTIEDAIDQLDQSRLHP